MNLHRKLLSMQLVSQRDEVPTMGILLRVKKKTEARTKGQGRAGPARISKPEKDKADCSGEAKPRMLRFELAVHVEDS